MGSGVHQDVHSFFEGTPHEGATVLSVDTVPSNGHQVTFSGHNVTKQGQMPIVDIKTIEIEHKKDLFFHAFPHSFDTKHLENLTDIVADSPCWVNISFG